MTQILVVVDLPATQHALTGEYLESAGLQIVRFESTRESIAQPTTGCQKLARNVWLLDAEKSWPVLSALCSAARTCSIPFQVLAVESAVFMTEQPSAPAPSGWSNPLPAPKLGTV
jgi:hypothetical protein